MICSRVKDYFFCYKSVYLSYHIHIFTVAIMESAFAIRNVSDR